MEQPTQVVTPGGVQPARVAEPAPRVDALAVHQAAQEENYWENWARRIRDDLSSLRLWLGLLTVLTLIALALSAYNYAQKRNEQPASSGDQSGEVSRLNSRVDELSRQTQNRASTEDLSELEARVEKRASKGEVDKMRATVTELKNSVDRLNKSAGSGSAPDQAALDEIQSQLEDMEDRLRKLESASPGNAP